MEESSGNDHEGLARHVLVVCSGGGHWIQMKRILPAFNKNLLSVATVDLSCAQNAGVDFHAIAKIPDFNRKNLLAVIRFFPESYRLIRKLKPTHVISTGAAPGIVAMMMARILGCKTLWIDSVANTKKLSMSGRIACFFASEVFTQWEHLDGSHGAKYAGKVI